MTDAYVVGAGMCRFGKFPDRTLWDVAMDAVSAVLADADIDPERVERSARALPGNVSTHHAVRMSALPSFSLLPQQAVGG